MQKPTSGFPTWWHVPASPGSNKMSFCSSEQAAMPACFGVCRVAVTPVPALKSCRRGHTPAWEGRVPARSSPGCRAVAHPAWGTGSQLSAGTEWGGWLCLSSWRFPGGWAVMLWGRWGDSMCVLEKLLGQWQCGYGDPGAGERPCTGQSCISHQDSLLETAPSHRGITRGGVQGLSLLSCSWTGGTAK